MAYVDVELANAAEIRNIMARVEPSLRRRLIRFGLVAAAGVVRKEARRTAPVLTGGLKRSYRVFPKRYKRFGVVSAGSVRPNAHLVERGTIKQAANPVLTQALQSTSEAQFTAAINAMRKKWRDVVRGARRSRR